MLFVVDKQLEAVDAIRASIKLVTQNFGNTSSYWVLAAARAVHRRAAVRHRSPHRQPDGADRSGLHLPPVCRASPSPPERRAALAACPHVVTAYGWHPASVGRTPLGFALSMGDTSRATPRLPAMSDAYECSPPTVRRTSATGAIGYGWRKFKASPSTLLVPMIVVLVVLAAVGVIVSFVASGGFFGSQSCTTSRINGQVSQSCGQSFWRQLLGAGLGAAILTLVAQIILAGIYRGALRIIDGEGFSLGQLFEGYNKMQVVFASHLHRGRHGHRHRPLLPAGGPDRLPHLLHAVLHRRPAARGRRGHPGEREDGLAQLLDTPCCSDPGRHLRR